jgi:hypothetical protein
MSDSTTELRRASEEHSVRVARFNALKSQVLDRNLPLELRLRAHMLIDAEIWRRRQVVTEYAGEPDKITITKQEAERRRLAVQHAERMEAGLPVRSRHHIVGRWSSTEGGDAMGAPPPGICVECGRRFTHRTSLYCSPCRRAIYNAERVRRLHEARKARRSVNHDSNSGEKRPAAASH